MKPNFFNLDGKKAETQASYSLSTETDEFKRLIMHITESDKENFDQLKKKYLQRTHNYLKAGSNAGFFSLCVDHLISNHELSKLPNQYVRFISRRGKRPKIDSKRRDVSLQLNIEQKYYIKYLALMFHTTEGSPDVSTAQFFSTFVDLIKDLHIP